MRTDTIRQVVAAGLLATLLPLPAAAEPDPNLLTALTFNDGVQNLTMARGNASGLHGPGLYYVWVPPGVRRVTVTPTWTNTNIGGIIGVARDVTYGTAAKEADAPNWAINASGTGKALELKRRTTPPQWGNGATMLTLALAGTADVTVQYRFLLQHNNSWKSAADQLRRLAINAGGGGQQNARQFSGQFSGGEAILLGATAGAPQRYTRQAAAGTSTAVELNPPFNDEIYTYTARVPSDVTQVTLDVTPSDSSATVTVNGGAGDSAGGRLGRRERASKWW